MLPIPVIKMLHCYLSPPIKNEFEFIARKLDISTDELNSYMNMPKKFYWDYPNEYHIYKIGAKILNKFGSELTIKR